MSKEKKKHRVDLFDDDLIRELNSTRESYLSGRSKAIPAKEMLADLKNYIAEKKRAKA